MNQNARIANAIYGLALGDAFSYKYEFVDNSKMLYLLHNMPHKVEIGEEKSLLVSDDTQMSIYLMGGILDWIKDGKKRFTYHVGRNFLDWYNDPLNTRAPGAACLESLGALQDSTILKGLDIDEYPDYLDNLGAYTTPKSMGSGTMMRSPWMGVIGAVSNRVFVNEDEMIDYTIKQSKLTHGHSGAHATASLTAYLTYHFVRGVDATLEDITEMIETFIDDYGNKVEMAEITKMLDILKSIPSEWYEGDDYNSNIGNYFTSWAAPSVLGSAIAILIACQNDIIAISNRCSFSNQDSDTVGAVAGAFAGALSDDPYWCCDYVGLLEPHYQGELDGVIEFIEVISD